MTQLFSVSDAEHASVSTDAIEEIASRREALVVSHQNPGEERDHSRDKVLQQRSEFYHRIFPSQPIQQTAQECDGTVAYLFLVREAIPFSAIWRRYFDSCPEGSYVVHAHIQEEGARPPDLAELHLVEESVTGNLRMQISMVRAMEKLWAQAATATAPNGCKPRWAQLLSDSCAPLVPCNRFQNELALRPGISRVSTSPATKPCPDADPMPEDRQMGLQWTTLWMEHARELLMDEEEEGRKIYRTFGMKHGCHQGAPDEYFAPTMLNHLDLKYQDPGSTFVDWGPHQERNGHPREICCGREGCDLSHFAMFDQVPSGFAFARKFNPNCAELLSRNLEEFF